MKYFEIQDTLELEFAPRLRNWTGKLDVRNIRIDAFPKIPKKQLFTIEPSKNTIFTDIILFPFLLVSPIVHNVIKMYGEKCFFREVILLDQESGESKLYYLPVLDETSEILLQRIQYNNGVAITDKSKREEQMINLKKNLFWVRDYNMRHIIVSLDMAESMIRRKVTGLGLCEIALYKKI